MPPPFKLRKAPKRELYWVVSADGKKHSKDPIPKERAEAQIRALYAVESGYTLDKSKSKKTKEKKSKTKKGGDLNDVGQVVTDVAKNVIFPAFNKVIPGLGSSLNTAGDVLTNLFTDKGAEAAEAQRQAQVAQQKAQYEQQQSDLERIRQTGSTQQRKDLAMSQAMSYGFGKPPKKRTKTIRKRVKLRGKGDDEEMEELIKLFSEQSKISVPKESGRKSKAEKPIVKKKESKSKSGKKRRAEAQLETIAEEEEGDERMEGKGLCGAGVLEDLVEEARQIREHLNQIDIELLRVADLIRQDPENVELIDRYERLSNEFEKYANRVERIAKRVRAIRSGDPEGPDTPEGDPEISGEGKLLKIMPRGFHYLLKGGGPIPDRSILHKIALQSYEAKPMTKIGMLELVSSSPTLKIYKGPDKTIVVGIRGTVPSDKDDILADGRVGIGELEKSDRYKRDLAMLQQIQLKFPPSVFEYYGVGHSLGGAILDEFLKAGLLKKGVSYNPAVSVGDFKSAIPNQRIYNKEDPLYQLMGRHTEGAEVRGERKKNWWEKAVEKIPYAGKAYNYFKAHQLENFSGGGKYSDLLKSELDDLLRKYPNATRLLSMNEMLAGHWNDIYDEAKDELGDIGSTRGSAERKDEKIEIIREAIADAKKYLESIDMPAKKYKDIGFKDELDFEVGKVMARYKKIPAEMRSIIKEAVDAGKEDIKAIGRTGTREGLEYMKPSEVAKAKKKMKVIQETVDEVEELLANLPYKQHAKVRNILPTEEEIMRRAEDEELERRFGAEKEKVGFEPTKVRGKGKEKKSSAIKSKRVM